jgi:hypothetical protein
MDIGARPNFIIDDPIIPSGENQSKIGLVNCVFKCIAPMLACSVTERDIVPIMHLLTGLGENAAHHSNKKFPKAIEA